MLKAIGKTRKGACVVIQTESKLEATKTILSWYKNRIGEIKFLHEDGEVFGAVWKDKNWMFFYSE